MSISGARKVTEAEAFGTFGPGGADPAEGAQSDSRMAPNYFDARIPADRLTQIREEVRRASYPNSAVEQETIAAVDAAIFERVSRAEEQSIGHAEYLLATQAKNSAAFKQGDKPNVMQKAEAHLDELHAIRGDLRDGRKSVAELAERYQKVRNAIQNGDAARLLRLAQEAESVRKQIADPLANTQRVLSLMPRGNWRPLGIGRW